MIEVSLGGWAVWAVVEKSEGEKGQRYSTGSGSRDFILCYSSLHNSLAVCCKWVMWFPPRPNPNAGRRRYLAPDDAREALLGPIDVHGGPLTIR